MKKVKPQRGDTKFEYFAKTLGIQCSATEVAGVVGVLIQKYFGVSRFFLSLTNIGTTE